MKVCKKTRAKAFVPKNHNFQELFKNLFSTWVESVTKVSPQSFFCFILCNLKDLKFNIRLSGEIASNTVKKEIRNEKKEIKLACLM